VLIKKKDVNSYFAARRASHPLGVKKASVPAATKTSKVKRGSKAVNLAGALDVQGSSVPTAPWPLTPVASERGFVDAPPPIIRRWAKT
jgi:hypothetical protein